MPRVWHVPVVPLLGPCLSPGVRNMSATLEARPEASCSAGHGPAAGPYAQGWGPLRVWPGGLCLSRALGDFDVGAIVLAIPHIMQVRNMTIPHGLV